MPKTIPAHVEGLLRYLSRPDEKANEDLALAYFRKVWGDNFTRQEEAERADGYVPGSFVLELKGRTNDWLSGLFQGLAYRNKGLDFSQIVVAAKNFLAVWQVSDLPEEMRDGVLAATDAPSRIGSAFAKQYSSSRNALLKLATWNGAELASPLFQQPVLVVEKIKSFERTIQDGQKVRLKVTLKNFTAVLKEMKEFFDPNQPVKAVRAFYSMVYGWTETSTIQLSDKVNHKATLGGEAVTDLVPSKRGHFKDYVETRFIHLRAGENTDDFFAQYDKALDAVDKSFRIRHGIFFTDLDLSKFVMWLVKQHVPNLGKNYLVIDPACGSGNLVTNWKSPLELRHKVVSEIEPELLFAVEKRMHGDQWHKGKFTVVPKVTENKGLNFLDRSADEYLEVLRDYLQEKGLKPDRPLAFLCNPPYRNNDDQTAETIDYEVHESITQLTGMDAMSERYCCFLAQMKRICEAAKSNGFPEDSLLLLFTKSAWLTRRNIFADIRAHMLEAFDDVTGILVNGSEFFDVRGTWPVAFSVWRYRPNGKTLVKDRSIPLFDLTWVTKGQLANIPWDKPEEMEQACQTILQQSQEVKIGVERVSIRDWSSEKMLDFKRDRRKDERNQIIVGGLPLGDRRQSNSKAYGESDGCFIGFMDDLTPCRVKRSTVNRPWFRLNSQFMDVKKNRCFSGPPTHWGFCASNLEVAKKLFVWYSLARTFLQHSYPMWADADDMWGPTISDGLGNTVCQFAFAIGYAENECVETVFPANNPVPGVPELIINNPMTPLVAGSFWTTTMLPYCSQSVSPTPRKLREAVDKLFDDWNCFFKSQSELPISSKPYSIDDRGLTVGAGILQIKDYAKEADDKTLQADLSEISGLLKSAKTEFFELVTATSGLEYFGPRKKKAASATAAVDSNKSRRDLA
jgi:hypothetical protein